MKKSNKKFVYGTGSATLIAGVCIVILLLNLIAGLLSDKFGLKLDATETGLSFSSEFNEYIKSVDKEIDVYYMCNPNEMIRISGKNDITETTGQVDNSNYRIRIKYMFEKIEKINSKIHFEVFDPDTNPDKVKRFGTVNIDDIVFVCGNMINSFNVNEILGQDKSGRYLIDGESKFASMINSVIRETKVKIGIVTGHGDGDTTEIKKVFDDEGVVYKDFNILADGISNDYDMIFIYGPTVDFSLDELERIENYLASGKDMQVYLNKVKECPQLVEYLKILGLEYTSDYIKENNPENLATINNGKTYIVPDWYEISHPIKRNINNSLYIPDSVGITKLWKSKNSIDVYGLLKTSQFAGLYSDEKFEKSYDIVAISKRVTDSMYYSDVMVCGSSDIYNSKLINTNKALLVNSVFWMGRIDESTEFTPTVITNAPMMTSQSHHNTLQLIFVVIIPFIIIVAGLVVWLKRRYL